jgi:hypothetical protein
VFKLFQSSGMMTAFISHFQALEKLNPVIQNTGDDFQTASERLD